MKKLEKVGSQDEKTCSKACIDINDTKEMEHVGIACAISGIFTCLNNSVVFD